MFSYVDICDKEISWLGSVKQNDNIYIIEDVMLFEQEVTGSTTEISEQNLNDFGSSLIA